ncbi:MAG: DUF1456 family protein [Flavobacteriales bacterium]|nr:DUF1456 family protein [Flavobacteriales bacterium]
MALNNNDIIKKLRVALKLRDDQIVDILQLVDFRITRSELGAFFRNEDHPKYMPLQDQILRNFLNGLVIYLRGPKDGKPSDKKASDFKPKDSQPKDSKPKDSEPVAAKPKSLKGKFSFKKKTFKD